MTLQLYEIANFNLIEFASIYNKFIDTNDPTEIEAQWIDKDGNINTTKIENVALIKQMIKSDIKKEAKTREDADKALDQKIIQIDTKISKQLAEEIQNRINSDKTLEDLINGKIEEVNSNFSKIEDALNNEVSRVNQLEEEFNKKISDEITARETGDNQLNSKITKLVSDEGKIRATEDSKLNDKIDNINVTLSDKLGKEIQDRINGDNQTLSDAKNYIDNSIKTEKEARIAADTEVKTYVDGNFLNKVTTKEQTVASSVNFLNDVVINGNFSVKSGKVTKIKTEQLKVNDNIITLNSNVPANSAPTENAGIEINRGKEGVMPFIIWDEANDVAKVVVGKDADGNWVLASVATDKNVNDLQAELSTTQNKLEAAQNELSVTQAELKAAQNELKTIQTKLETIQTEVENINITSTTGSNNAGVIYEANEAATSFTITHNLGSQFVDVAVWIYNETTGKYCNGQATVSVIDDNTVEIDLISAAKIRATIQSVTF